jgi:SAM-dependent methyltransferase
LAIEPIPLQENSIDFATAHNFVEHIPRIIVSEETRFPFIEFMSEAHRVLKPNGLFYSKTPAYPKNEAFQDPTHINIITNETFPYYFCWHPFGGPWGRLYGFNAKFELASQRWQGVHLLTVLRKI